MGTSQQTNKVNEMDTSDNSSDRTITDDSTLDDSNPRSARRERRYVTDSTSSRRMHNTRDSVSLRGICLSSRLLGDSLQDESAEYISYDLNEPWQRSLQRELEKIHITDDKERVEKIWLGRTQSGDFFQPFDRDDDATVDTNASSTVPSGPQYVHRYNYRRSLFDDESTYHASRFSTKDNSRQSSQDSDPTFSDDEEEGRDEAFVNAGLNPRGEVDSRSIPRVLPKSRQKDFLLEAKLERTKAYDERDEVFLEIEVPSNEEMDMDRQIQDGCSCWGYNMIDFWFLDSPSTPGRQRRMSNMSIPEGSPVF